ncbi:regulatory protein RecX [Streptobacillus canis]|uniref:regulatory protein RecX n=1 Tax=Streptobacillus canis TaxID=2678686 RepID=UPI0012E177C0|nr:regulatory protein RecX [Streptobacillus canis]
MKKIDKIIRNKIYMQDGEVIDINLDIKSMFKLKNNMDITDIYNDIIFESMKSKAIYLISIKDRTIFELKQKLKEKYSKENHDNISKVVDVLQSLNLLDDLSFAKKYININSKYGVNKLKSKLLTKGVNFENINKAVESIDLKDNQEYEIKKIMSKNIGIDRQKLFRKLINKGFEYQSILCCLNCEVDE